MKYFKKKGELETEKKTKKVNVKKLLGICTTVDKWGNNKDTRERRKNKEFKKLNRETRKIRRRKKSVERKKWEKLIKGRKPKDRATNKTRRIKIEVRNYRIYNSKTVELIKI